MEWEKIFVLCVSCMKVFEICEFLKLFEQFDIIFFVGGIFDVVFFLVEEFFKVYVEVLIGLDVVLVLQYLVFEGYKLLCEWLVGEMGKLGIFCMFDNIFIVFGLQQGFDYIGKVLFLLKDMVLVIWLIYMGVFGVFNVYELNYDKFDLMINCEFFIYVEKVVQGGGCVKFVYCVLEFFNLLGEMILCFGCENILNFVEVFDIVIVEDVVYQQFCYSGEIVKLILVFDIECNGGDIDKMCMFYCGFFFKMFVLGFCFGYIVVVQDVICKLVLVKQVFDLYFLIVNQVVMGKVVYKIFDVQVEKICKIYSYCCDWMFEVMMKYMLVGVEWMKLEGGMFVWVMLLKGFDGVLLLVKVVCDYCIVFVFGKVFYVDGMGENMIWFFFFCVFDEVIEIGIFCFGIFIKGEMLG